MRGRRNAILTVLPTNMLSPPRSFTLFFTNYSYFDPPRFLSWPNCAINDRINNRTNSLLPAREKSNLSYGEASTEDTTIIPNCVPFGRYTFFLARSIILIKN